MIVFELWFHLGISFWWCVENKIPFMSNILIKLRNNEDVNNDTITKQVKLFFAKFISSSCNIIKTE